MNGYPFFVVIGALLLGTFSFLLGFVFRKRIAVKAIREAEREAEKVLSDTKRERENIKKAAVIEAKENLYKAKVNFEEEASGRRKALE